MLYLLRRELSHFKSLPSKAKYLLISFVMQGAASTLISIFINAYIWRTQGDIVRVVLYNLGDFIALPIFFYLNGLLLRRFDVNKLYFLGALCIGLSSVLVIFYTWFAPAAYLIYGLVYGVGHGIYWANRNLLTLQETESRTRNYFIGINFSVDFLTSILVPFVTGWFIALGSQFHLIPTQMSYGVSMGFAFILLLVCGITPLGLKFERETITDVHLPKSSPRWTKVRLMMMGMGIAEAASFFLPTVLTLMKLGNEGILGTVSAITSLLSAGAMYLFGRLADVKHRQQLLAASIGIGFVSALILAFYRSNIGIILYICLNSFTVMLMWLAAEPIMLDIVDEERVKNGTEKYAHVFDRELFLNIGRMILMVFCLGTGSFLFLPLVSWGILIAISAIVFAKSFVGFPRE